MIDAHTRYAGIDPCTGINTRIKTAALRDIQPFMLSLQFRMAWGRLGLYGRYGLLNVFEFPTGETIRPVSLGLTISLY